MSRKGFTLVELAIVLIIIGLLVGAGAGLIGPLTKRAKLIETKDTLKQAREAFVGYAVKNGYLPASSGYSTYTPDSAFDMVGVRGVDAFTKPIRYVVATEVAGSGKNLCGANATTLTLTDRGQTKGNIAFLLVSGGLNYNIQTNTTIYEQDSPNIDDFPTDMNRPEPYDDIVEYVSLDQLKTSKGCPQSLTISSPSQLPEAEEDSFYSYQLQATGGVPPYSWEAKSIGCGLTINPTGLISGTVNCYNQAPNTGELDDCIRSINFNTNLSDAGGSAAQTYNGTISVRPRPLKILTEILPPGAKGSSYTAVIVTSGGRVPRSSNPPSTLVPGVGLTDSSATTYTYTGTIENESGCYPTTYNPTITVQDNCGPQISKTYSIAVSDPDCYSPGSGSSNCPNLALNPPSGTTWNVTTDENFNQSVAVYGGVIPYINTQCNKSGNCGGLNIPCTQNGATISGTPTQPGICTFSPAWRDSCSPTPQNISGTYTVNIGCPGMTLNPASGTTFTAQENQNFSESILVSGGYGARYKDQCVFQCSNVQGLSATCNSNGANISGIPICSTSCGSCTLQAKWKDSCPLGNQTITGTYTVTVEPSPVALVNKTGKILYYQKGSSQCQTLGDDSCVLLNSGDSIIIYKKFDCNNPPTCNLTYSQIRGEDQNKDYHVSLTSTPPQCALSEYTGNPCF